MTALIDVDQLRTFIAIAETGSFTKAAEVVHKTQSAVSMQMKRLEERLERPIFARDGRASKLTEDGTAPARLRAPHRQAQRRGARRLLRRRTVRPRAARRAGRLRRPLSARDHGALLARLSGVELTVICEPSVDLLERIDANEIDLAIVTNCESKRASETFRRERLLWVTSNRHSTHLEEPLPLALGRPSCAWRRIAIERLETIGRPLPHALLELECRRGRRRRARRARGFGASGIGPAPRHARAHRGGRFSRIAELPHRAGAQCARELGARRRARRAHHLVARQPVGSAGGGVRRRMPPAHPSR